MKCCLKCNKNLPLTDFSTHSTSKDKLSSHCRKCKYDYDYIYRRTDKYKEKESIRAIERRKYDWRIRFRGAYNNAIKRGYEWSISIEDVPIPDDCPLLGIPLVMGDSYRWNKPSIDRIDQSKGYIQGNVWVISVLANTMKSIATIEQLNTFANNIKKHFPFKSTNNDLTNANNAAD